MQFYFRNINDAFQHLVNGIYKQQIPTTSTPSRNGDVLQIAEPCLLSYGRPTERVLFNRARDANPYFHLYESLWMLAGRNDVGPLIYYNKKYADFSDNFDPTTGLGSANGAYGYRWRKAPGVAKKLDNNMIYTQGVDQLNEIVAHLKEQPNSRRAVLQMWNVRDDLLKIDHRHGTYSKDVCCNLSVMFSLRELKEEGQVGQMPSGSPAYGLKYALDMTVTNRSNDLIWGCLGANYVHFSFLQEYMAARLGAEVGRYHQFSNNLHIYTWNWKPKEWLAEYVSEGQRTMHSPPPSLNYDQPRFKVFVPLVHNPETFDKEVQDFVDFNENDNEVRARTAWKEPFLRDVAQPMCHAWHMHKARDYKAVEHWLNQIVADDWRIACMGWMLKRERKWEAKQDNV